MRQPAVIMKNYLGVHSAARLCRWESRLSLALKAIFPKRGPATSSVWVHNIRAGR